jgi:hypothetical protein
MSEDDAAVVTEAEAAGQARLLEIADQIEAISTQLLSVHDSFQVSPRGAAMLLGEEELDVSTALRSVIECVLADRLEPAQQELRKWAEYEPKKARK